ncbi:retrovirus-related pol polyprotein from transposon TNT 1-94 [Tanacetum coccineum]
MDKIISQEIVNIVLNFSVIICDSEKKNEDSVDTCNKCLELEVELVKTNDVYIKLSKRFSNLEQHCLSLDVAMQLNKEMFQKDKSSDNRNHPEIQEYFEQSDLKAQLQAKDTVISKLKQAIHSLRENANPAKVKKDIDEIETINIELEHSVSKLLSKNEKLHKEKEHLKKTYKELYDSIKLSRVHAKEQCDSLIVNLNSKSMENADLKAQIQEKPTSTKNNRISQSSSSNKTNKVEDQSRSVKSRENKKNRVAKTECNAYVMQSVLNANSESVCAICNECLIDANHDKCVLDCVCGVNVLSNLNLLSKKIRSRYGNLRVVQIVLWYLDSRCSKHMTGNRSQLTNFVNEFISTIKFGNDQIAKIMGYGDYHIKNVTISRVYYVEGLRHNLFSVSQFYYSDLEVAFRKHICFVCKLDGVDLLMGSQGNNLYTLSIGDMMKSSLIFLLSKASKTKSWLWHRRLSHLNFGTINQLAKQGLVRGLPKLKFEKDHLCSACSLGKSKKQSHKPKSEDTNQEKLYLLHMDLYGPMRVESINGKKYILVIVDDYSWFTWVKFVRSKDEAPEFIIKFLKMIQVCLNATVRNIRTDNGTEFINQTLCSYYEDVGIFHETSVARTPQQNGVVERRNRTLVEAAHTILIYANAPLFLWAEAVATTCYTSLIRLCHEKTPYELLHDRKPDLSYLHVFGALCYPTNDNEDLGKLKAKADVGIFIGYAPAKKAYLIYNRCTRQIMETIHVDFDELTAMASKQSSLGPILNEITPGILSSGLVPQPPSSTPFIPPTRDDWDILFQPLFDEYFRPSPCVDHPVPEVAAPVPAVSTSISSLISVDQDAPSPSTS